MKTSTLLPALRAVVGDWNYYVTTLTFREVAALVKAPDEIHERKKLADWIQRSVIEKHASAISTYLQNTPQRFLGSLIVGVYGGAPNWTPVTVNVPEEDGIAEELIANLEGRIGLLHFSGAEKLFAIDGQHRVAGIKEALLEIGPDHALFEDSLSAIFVAHDPKTEVGKQRTRRLFTTVNKKAKIVSKAARIALDEDDGFAIVTRRLIDSHWLFEDERKYVLYGSTGSLPSSDSTSITSVVGLFELVKDLHFGDSDFGKERPDEPAIEEHLKYCSDYFDELLSVIPEYKSVFLKAKHKPGYYRTPERNHMLFRPMGQRTFARAVQLLVSRGITLPDAVKELAGAELYLQNEEWQYILWDPISATMIVTKVLMAEAQLLRLTGNPLRTKASGLKLDALLASKES
jgi:DNA sulfur modification protein DndB